MLKAMKGGIIVKVGAIAILGALLLFLGAQIYSLFSQTSKTEKELAELEQKLQQAKEDQSKFAADMEYYLNPENFKKELKGRFNYKEPGEKVLILVNKEASSSTPTSTSSTP